MFVSLFAGVLHFFLIDPWEIEPSSPPPSLFRAITVPLRTIFDRPGMRHIPSLCAANSRDGWNCGGDRVSRPANQGTIRQAGVTRGARNSSGIVPNSNVSRPFRPLAHRSKKMPVLCRGQRVQVDDKGCRRRLVPVCQLQSRRDAEEQTI